MANIRDNIYFTADLHFGHHNAFSFCPSRNDFAKDITDYEEKFIDYWNSTVNKSDNIYILGDFSFKSSEDNAKIIPKLKGKKHLIIGNHDSNCFRLKNLFTSVSQIKELRVKPSPEHQIFQQVRLVLCHFPLMSWNLKAHGSWMIHGHVHGNMDAYNSQHYDLRVDVGVDSILGRNRLVSFNDLYQYFTMKTGTADFQAYMNKVRKEHASEIII